MIRRVAMALAIMAAAASAAELSLERGVLSAGKPAALKMTLAAGKDVPTGVQFDLEYDADALDVTIEAGPAALKASKGLRSAQIRMGKLRALIIGINRTTISDGVIAIVHVSYKGAGGGKTFPIHVTAVAGTNADAQPVAVAAKDSSVRVEK
jgi:hypothetical protein